MQVKAILGAIALTAASASVDPAVAQTNVLFVFDASGSMKRDAGAGENRMVVAKRAIGDTLRSMPASARLGLMVYGHRRSKDCADIELVSPIASEDAEALARYVGALDARGETPIAEALLRAGKSFAAFQGQSNRIVLVTDGIEECRGDPCAAARTLAGLGVDLKVDVVGFTLSDAQRKLIQCVPDITGGRYYDARDSGALRNALAQVRETVAKPPAPPERFNLLSPKNGGAVLVAPNDAWQAAADEKEAVVSPYALRTGQDGVFGFRDDRPAKFDTFAVLVSAAKGRNVKEVELLASDEGPTGQFRAIATCTFQNAKLLRSPYQECKFDPVTARFLKVKIVSAHDGGNYFDIEEWRLFGELQDGAAAAAQSAAMAAKPSSRFNLISPKNGGAVLVAPNDAWQAAADEKEAVVSPYALRTGQDGVFGFRDDRPAKFDTFAVLVSAAKGRNVKEVELLASDEGPTGQFRAIATCTFQNAKLLRSPYQECKFEPVTARFLKVKIVSAHDGGNYFDIEEWRLFGELQDGAAAAAQSKPSSGSTPPPAASSSRSNLISPKNGGAILVAANDAWQTAADDKEDVVSPYALRTGQDGVFGFRDDRPAKFDTFAVLVSAAKGRNVKEVELLASDEGPTGQFRAIATCTFQNAKLLRSPYQECKFDPVTARFLKVKIVSAHDDGNYFDIEEWRLFGELQP